MIDELVKSPDFPFFVIPAEAGSQVFQLFLDSRFHGSDDFETTGNGFNTEEDGFGNK